MKLFFAACALTFVAPLAVHAQDCPSSPDHSAEIQSLIRQLQDVGDQRSARTVSGQLWGLWLDAPDERAQAALDRGLARLQAQDYSAAISEFDALITYCPDYAEGYNQRAFAYYLQQDFGTALPDLDKAIALSPNHVAAISGRALTLLGLNRIDEARETLKQALSLNPWLSERHLLGPGGPLEPKGEDI